MRRFKMEWIKLHLILSITILTSGTTFASPNLQTTPTTQVNNSAISNSEQRNDDRLNQTRVTGQPTSALESQFHEHRIAVPDAQTTSIITTKVNNSANSNTDQRDDNILNQTRVPGQHTLEPTSATTPQYQERRIRVPKQGKSSRPQQSFQVPPVNITAAVGSNASFQCVVDNLMGVIQWAKDGGAVLGNPRWTIVRIFDHGVSHLNIENVTMTDLGDYECQVGPKPGVQPIRAKARLSVVGTYHTANNTLPVVSYSNSEYVEMGGNYAHNVTSALTSHKIIPVENSAGPATSVFAGQWMLNRVGGLVLALVVGFSTIVAIFIIRKWRMLEALSKPFPSFIRNEDLPLQASDVGWLNILRGKDVSHAQSQDQDDHKSIHLTHYAVGDASYPAIATVREYKKTCHVSLSPKSSSLSVIPEQDETATDVT
ncbi:hypothetical protein QAD02_013694 [Eretmocerus hayati]|uniref:Uncharacterized protein n=1 Tax=Eretmocerus hayati TaxID=131215 RepID=A0ACC2P636_9HYME|nr:hypothetical protein QAD02_013694 [Eretmocerus hayati]